MALKGRDGWSALFSKAFEQSRNAMVLLDDQRRLVDINGACARLLGHGRDALIGEPVSRLLAGGPLLSPAAWEAALGAGQFTGVTDLLCADGGTVTVQWGASAEVVSARRLVLFVALSTSRWGRHFRRTAAGEGGALTPREREVVRLIALGSTGPEIADELHIVHDTVRTHVRNAMTKLGARSRAHLVAKALGDGLVVD
jgi:PAS domain S-box-containing protein